MAILESNTDLDVKGRVLATTVPNSTGSIVTWNSTSKVFGLRSNAQIISDLDLVTTSVLNAGLTTKANTNGNNLTNIQDWRDNLGIGTLNSLSTTNKSNLVSAINEVNSNSRNSRTYASYYSGLTSSGLLFKDENGDDFSTTSSTGRIYDIRLSTSATRNSTGARYVLYNDGTGWHVEEIAPSATNVFQARLRINSSGLPEIFNNSTNPAYGAYANVTVYRIDSGKGAEWKRFISLDYSLLFNTPTIPTSNDYITTNTNQTGLSGNKTTSGWWAIVPNNSTGIAGSQSPYATVIRRSEGDYGSLIEGYDANGDLGYSLRSYEVGSIPQFELYNGTISSQGYKKYGQSNSSVLLAGGGHRPVSDFALAGSLSGYLPLTGGTMGNTATIYWSGADYMYGIIHKHRNVASGGLALGRMSNNTHDKGLGLSTTGDFIFGDWSDIASLSTSWNTVWHSGNLTNPATENWVNAKGFSTQTLTAGSNITISGDTISATNTTYSAGTGLSLSGTTFGQAITTSGTGTYVQSITQTASGFQVNLGTPPNTTYSAGTVALLTAGTNTSNRVWSASILSSWVNQQGFLTSVDLSGYATEAWVKTYGIGKPMSQTNNISTIERGIPGGLYSTSTSTVGGPMSGSSGSLISIGAGVSGGTNSFIWVLGNNTTTPRAFFTHAANTGDMNPWEEIATHSYVASQIPTNYVPTSRTITAGNGLTGGGSLASNRTITLGTPGAITLSSTNSVGTSSHTHAFTPGGTTAQYIRGDGSLATYANTTYSAGTVALLTAGTNTTNRVWSARNLHDGIMHLINQNADSIFAYSPQGGLYTTNWSSNALGQYALAIGHASNATAQNATAVGSAVFTGGFGSTNVGFSSNVNKSLAGNFGTYNTNNHRESFTYGLGLQSASTWQTVIGRYNKPNGAGDIDDWTDIRNPIFILGVGQDEMNRKNSVSAFGDGRLDYEVDRDDTYWNPNTIPDIRWINENVGGGGGNMNYAYIDHTNTHAFGSDEANGLLIPASLAFGSSIIDPDLGLISVFTSHDDLGQYSTPTADTFFNAIAVEVNGDILVRRGCIYIGDVDIRTLSGKDKLVMVYNRIGDLLYLEWMDSFGIMDLKDNVEQIYGIIIGNAFNDSTGDVYFNVNPQIL